MAKSRTKIGVLKRLFEVGVRRSPQNIGALMADGEKQARVFLKDRRT